MWWVQTVTKSSQESWLMGRDQAMLEPMNLTILYRPGPAKNAHSQFICAHMLQNQFFASGFCSPWGWHLLEPLTWARVYCRNKRQMMPQEFRERSLWKVTVESWNGRGKNWKGIDSKAILRKMRNFAEKGQGSSEPWQILGGEKRRGRPQQKENQRNRCEMICKRTRNYQN